MAMFLSAGSRINIPTPGEKYKLILIRNKDTITYDTESTISIDISQITPYYSSLTNDSFIIDVDTSSASSSTQRYGGNYTESAQYSQAYINYQSDIGTLYMRGPTVIGNVVNATRTTCCPIYRLYALCPVDSQEDVIVKIGSSVSDTQSFDISSIYSDYSSLTRLNFIINPLSSISETKTISLSTSRTYIRASYNKADDYYSYYGRITTNCYIYGGFATNTIVLVPNYDVYLWVPNNS